MVFLVRKCINCFSNILTKGLIEGLYLYGVLMSIDKTAHSCSYNLCQQTQEYIAGWDVILLVVCDKTLSNKVIKFIRSLHINIRTKCFFMWRESSYQQKIMNKKGKVPSMASLIMVAKYVKWQHTQQTSAEQFRQSHRYVTLRHLLGTRLRTLRLQCLPRIIWLLLRRVRLCK
jgi:hypothetical protein